MKTLTAEDQIDQLTLNFANQLTTLVRASVADDVARVLGGNGASHAKSRAVTRVPGGRSGKTRNLPPGCLVPGCKNPHKGPRYTFMCDTHEGVNKVDKARYLASWRESQAARRD